MSYKSENKSIDYNIDFLIFKNPSEALIYVIPDIFNTKEASKEHILNLKRKYETYLRENIKIDANEFVEKYEKYGNDIGFLVEKTRLPIVPASFNLRINLKDIDLLRKNLHKANIFGAYTKSPDSIFEIAIRQSFKNLKDMAKI